MKIIINGKQELLTEEMNLKKFLSSKDFSNSKVAIEYNGEILQSKDWEHITLRAGDVLEIIKFVGGG